METLLGLTESGTADAPSGAEAGAAPTAGQPRLRARRGRRERRRARAGSVTCGRGTAGSAGGGRHGRRGSGPAGRGEGEGPREEERPLGEEMGGAGKKNVVNDNDSISDDNCSKATG